MENHDETGSEIHGFVLFEKHLGNNTVHGMKEAVKQCPVIKEKLAEILVNGKNTVAPEGYEFELSTSRTAVHCPAKGGGAAVDHFIHVFNNRSTWM